MKKNLLTLMAGALIAVAPQNAIAQSELYPGHFDLNEVTLLDGPMKTAMDLNIQVLMQYDVDRLLTPFVRQAGLASTTDTSSPYYQWLTKHPSFTNWGDSSFDLSGHVGGHYLSALALAYAACHDSDTKALLKERLDYMVGVMKDCQDQFDDNTQGLYGFIGGQPIKSDWTALYSGNIQPFKNHGGWVPFYVQHKILAGLRDAYLYGGNTVAKELFRKMADWSVNVVSKVSDSNMQTVLDTEHGGMNESMADAYQLFGDQKYLDAAQKYTHKTMLNGMQSLNTTFLDGKHANTQVPKYIGMERIGTISSSQSSQYTKAAKNFWQDVAENRTVCIGGNSVNEHFLARANANRYIDQLDGPESCNTNNMLKLSEMMADRTAATDPELSATYVDFYEQAMWNHILSTQDPSTGGYVYFTTLRPQGYRIYSQVNQGMWCCVGTGMENHSKYGHFIYTHDGSDVLYVNLFVPSQLESDDFAITQETTFPNSNFVELTVGKAGNYTIALRHPAWAGKNFSWSVNGENMNNEAEYGKAYYIKETRNWAVGDKISITLDPQLRYEECPGYTDYIAFKYGPILLGAQTTAATPDEAKATGLTYEQLQNEYAGAGRMDHAPGSMAAAKNLLDAPLLIGNRADVLSRIQRLRSIDLSFIIDASRPDVSTYKWESLKLVPFYKIHHARYMCYWYQQTAENFAASDMAQTEAQNEALANRTIDFVATGEQQSEAGHEYNYSSDSSTGTYNGETYRDARSGGYVEYALYNPKGVTDSLSILCRFTTADHGRKASLLVDGQKIASITIPSSVKNADANGFYNIEYPIPAELCTNNGAAKAKFVVRLAADQGTLNPGLYYLRLMSGYDATAKAYRFICSDWTTGDANRIPASSITYDTDKNILHARSRGNNNIALMLRYQDCDYDIDKSQTYLVVRGTNLSTTDGHSYLWWLNGSNHGTQVKPTVQRTVTIGDTQQLLVAWSMPSSGIYENFSGDRPNVCLGMTIFGLTSTASDGSCDIYDINFVSDIDDYVDQSTALRGDVNADGQVGIGDIVAITNIMAGITLTIPLFRSDVNSDGQVGIGDIVAITNIMAGQSEE